MSLLTKSNPKLDKSLKVTGWRGFGLHLAPHKLSGKNLCASASQGCIASCLNTAGKGIYNRVQESRIKKTKMFNENREQFLETLYKEIQAKVKTAEKNNQKISFRLNLTSDVAWETVKYQGKTFMEHFPNVQFMDYTKHTKRMLNNILGLHPKNYHLTFSRSEKNQESCDIVLGCGGNVAVVFKGRLPKTYRGKKVIDGTTHDARFLDPKKCVVGLVALGKARKDKSGFVVNPKTGKPIR